MVLDDFKEKIANKNLTKTDKLIADYIIENFQAIGLSTVSEVAAGVGTSDTSVIRFLRSLGYRGYADFKRNINEQLAEQYSSNLSPVQKFANTKQKINNNSVLNDVFCRAIENLANTSADIDEKLVDSIADCILACAHKYVVGFRGTSSVAEYFFRKAMFFVPHIVLCDKAESETIEKMVDISKDDCLVMFAFPRYSMLNYSLLKLAKKRKAKIIIITDQVTSPLTGYGDYVVYTGVNGVGFTNSYVAPLCFAEALSIILGQKAQNNDARLADISKYIDDVKLY